MSQAPPFDIDPRLLEPARLELHHAIQLVALGVGRSLLPSRDDDSHTTLSWHRESRQWVGAPILDSGLHAGLRPADLTLTLGDADAPARETLPLDGSTLADGLAWLRERLDARGLPAADISLDAHYDLPPHPVADGAPLGRAPAPEREVLGAWFDLAARCLDEIAATADDASPIRVWPHHFDIATLLEAGRVAEGPTRTIGVGLSPGDDMIAEPYWYIGPWPRPADTSQLPPIPNGRWETGDFFGAVLPASEACASEGGPGPASRAFLVAAVAAARHVWDAESA